MMQKNNWKTRLTEFCTGNPFDLSSARSHIQLTTVTSVTVLLFYELYACKKIHFKF